MSFAEKIYQNVIGIKSKQEKERERINFIKELLSIYEKKKIKEKDVHDHAKNIASDFFVDEVVASKNGGDVVINSEKRVRLPTESNSEFFNQIKQKFPETKMVTLKIGEKYHTYYIDNETLYNMRSNGSISSLEAKKIVERIDKGMDKWQESLQ